MNFKPFVRILIPSVSLLMAFILLAFQHMENKEQSNKKQNDSELAKVEIAIEKDSQS